MGMVWKAVQSIATWSNVSLHIGVFVTSSSLVFVTSIKESSTKMNWSIFCATSEYFNSLCAAKRRKIYLRDPQHFIPRQTLWYSKKQLENAASGNCSNLASDINDQPCSSHNNVTSVDNDVDSNDAPDCSNLDKEVECYNSDENSSSEDLHSSYE